MTHVHIKDLMVDEALDNNQMAKVRGGVAVHTPDHTTLLQPRDEFLPNISNGIVIIGEEKYGGSGGEW